MIDIITMLDEIQEHTQHKLDAECLMFAISTSNTSSKNYVCKVNYDDDRYTYLFSFHQGDVINVSN